MKSLVLCWTEGVAECVAEDRVGIASDRARWWGRIWG